MSDTSAIDDKSGSSDSQTDNEKLKKFGQYISTILLPLIYCVFSGLVLFSCKVGQSKMLPTESDCFPFTTNRGTLEPSDANVVTLDIFTSGGLLTPTMSEKIHFDLKNNNDFQLLGNLLSYKQDPKTSAFENYASSVVLNSWLFQLRSVAKFFSFLNQTPETFIVIAGPAITFLVMFIAIIPIGFFIALYSILSQVNLLFKIHSSNREGGKDKNGDVLWESTSIFNVTGLITVSFLTFLFFTGLLFVSSFFMSFVSTCSAILTILYFNATITEVTITKDKDGKETGERETKDVPITPLKTFMKLVTVYQVTIATVMCLILFIIMSTIFEPVVLIPPAILIGLAGFGKIFNIFTQKEDPNLSPLTKWGNKEVVRKCPKSGGGSNEPSQMGGKRLVQEIKRVGSKLKKRK
jgi:hypothetical protein